MIYQKRSHSQNNQIYKNIYQKTKKLNSRSASLCKPTLFYENCFTCIQNNLRKKMFYHKIKTINIKFYEQKEMIQKLKLTDIKLQILMLQKWSNKLQSITHRVFESSLMQSFYKDRIQLFVTFKNQFGQRYYQFLLDFNRNLSSVRPKILDVYQLLNRTKHKICLPHNHIFVGHAINKRLNKLRNKRSKSQDDKINQREVDLTHNSKQKKYENLDCFCLQNLSKQWKFERIYVNFLKRIYDTFYKSYSHYMSILSKPQNYHYQKYIERFYQKQIAFLKQKLRQSRKQSRKLKFYHFFTYKKSNNISNKHSDYKNKNRKSNFIIYELNKKISIYTEKAKDATENELEENV